MVTPPPSPYCVGDGGGVAHTTPDDNLLLENPSQLRMRVWRHARIVTRHLDTAHIRTPHCAEAGFCLGCPPETCGRFWIREVVPCILIDRARSGDLIAVTILPKSYKPAVAEGGRSGRAQTFHHHHSDRIQHLPPPWCHAWTNTMVIWPRWTRG